MKSKKSSYVNQIFYFDKLFGLSSGSRGIEPLATVPKTVVLTITPTPYVSW